MANAAVPSASPPIIGLGVPVLRQGGQGYFASKNPYDTAWSDLMITLFTPIGGRAMNRSFGSALLRSVFDPITVAQANIVNYYIQTAAQLWCPHVTVLQVQSKIVNQTLSLGIVFSLTSDKTKTEQRSVLIPKSKILLLLQPQG